MRRKEAIATILVTTVLVFLASGRWIWAQTDDSSKSIEEVARTLAEQSKAIAVPFLKGKAKRKIEKDERTYALCLTVRAPQRCSSYRITRRRTR